MLWHVIKFALTCGFMPVTVRTWWTRSIGATCAAAAILWCRGRRPHRFVCYVPFRSTGSYFPVSARLVCLFGRGLVCSRAGSSRSPSRARCAPCGVVRLVVVSRRRCPSGDRPSRCRCLRLSSARCSAPTLRWTPLLLLMLLGLINPSSSDDLAYQGGKFMVDYIHIR